MFQTKDPLKISLQDTSQEVLFSQNTDDHYITAVGDAEKSPLASIDVIFPILHGTYGEDGAIQGLAKIANLPCVGPGILGSAIGMDKEVMKRLLKEAGINSAPWITIRRKEKPYIDMETIINQLGENVFVKPVNLGSSVGITHVRAKEQLMPAIQYAFEFDHKVIVEQSISGREIECAVLGNEDPIASLPGEVIPKDGFYSYDAKYLDEHGAALEIPADLTKEEIRKVQDVSIEAFTLLECSGMARVDMFLTEDGNVYINEINTIPGFTDISMYPSLWKISGISNEELIDRLIQLAIERHERDGKLKREV